MLPTIPFDPAGGRLWVDVSMEGLYFITYTYQLWSADPSEPPVLTNPLRSGNNQQPHDDHYPVQNDYTQDEPLAKFNNRVMDLQFTIRSLDSDNGYYLKVTVKQGADFDTASVCGAPFQIPALLGDGSMPPPAKVGTNTGSKSELIGLELIAQS